MVLEYIENEHSFIFSQMVYVTIFNNLGGLKDITIDQHVPYGAQQEDYEQLEDITTSARLTLGDVIDTIPASVEKYMTVNYSDGIPYIDIKLEPSWKNTYKSIQYYYCEKEDNKLASDGGSFNFVFGVNLNDEDFDNNLDTNNNPHIKVYISSLSTKEVII